MTRVKTNQRGFSLIEMMTGMLISTVVMGGVAATLFQLGKTQSNDQMQNLVNAQYFLGVQVANNPGLFAERGIKANALGLTAAKRAQLDACLGGIGQNCTALTEAPAAVPSTVDALLNASFNHQGTCAPNAPECLITRTVTYQWQCPAANSCSGLRLNVRVAVIEGSHASGDVYVKPREGQITLPARQFRSKGEVDFTCRGGARTLYGVDYTRMTDAGHCGSYDSQTLCDMPMTSYGPGDRCRPRQETTCANGYGTVGLFRNQEGCIPAALVTVTTGPGLPQPPLPPTQPEPDQTWTWHGIVYQSTCPFLCDGVEWATCAGPACAAPRIQCYTASPRGVPAHPINSTQTTQPSGYNCFLRGNGMPWIVI